MSATRSTIAVLLVPCALAPVAFGQRPGTVVRSTPVVLGTRLVRCERARPGEPVSVEIDGKIDGVSHYAFAQPLPSGAYRIGDRHYDARTGKLGYAIRFAKGRLEAVRPGGAVAWSRRLARAHARFGLGWSRAGVVAVCADGVRCLSYATGEPRWKRAGEARDVHLLHDVVLATVRRGVVGLDLAAGTERFLLEVPNALESGRLQVRDGYALFAGKDRSFVLDKRGRVLARLDASVESFTRNGPGFLFLTKTHLIGTKNRGRELWRRRLKELATDHRDDVLLQTLPDGDVVLALYDRISDSGIQLHRLRWRTGKTQWSTVSAPRGLSHSKFRHLAYLRIRGDRLLLVSQGPGVVEARNVADGRLLDRGEW